MNEKETAHDCCALPTSSADELSIETIADGKANCPSCGSEGRKVRAVTVQSLVREHGEGDPPGYLCRNSECAVVYFGPGRPVYRKEDLKVRVGFKEKEDPVPVCYCFEHTKAEIEEDFRKHGRSNIEESIRAEIKAGTCSCEFKNPTGKCCLGDVADVVKSLKASSSPEA